VIVNVSLDINKPALYRQCCNVEVSGEGFDILEPGLHGIFFQELVSWFPAHAKCKKTGYNIKSLCIVDELGCPADTFLSYLFIKKDQDAAGQG
jgi:hypothetical protein